MLNEEYIRRTIKTSVSKIEKIPYLTFEATNVGSEFSPNQVIVWVLGPSLPNDDILQYSYDCIEWHSVSEKIKKGTDFSEIEFQKTVFFRGKNQYGSEIVSGSGRHYSFLFYGQRVYARGDIRTLIDWEDYKTCDTSKATFVGLFADNFKLLSAPDLPIMDLCESCYERMFLGCTNLVDAPELPAIVLSRMCYRYMFCNCEKLENAPELPAMVATTACYSHMFENCISLKKAPNLPATILSDFCYSEMFARCRMLEEIPDILPALTLANDCYSNMFSNCIGLKKAPRLPAKELKEYCYQCMFIETDLLDPPELPAENLDFGCYENMFARTPIRYCPELPAKELKGNCYIGMFYGCTLVTKCPTLPAKKLASYCYSLMFAGTSIKTPPELPSESFNQIIGCYDRMFMNCKRLTKRAVLPVKADDISFSCPNMYLGTPVEHDNINEEYIQRKRNNNISTIIIDRTPYIHFYCDGNQLIMFNTGITYRDGVKNKYSLIELLKGLEYSIDKIIWNEITEKNIKFTNNIWIRGKRPVGTAFTFSPDTNDGIDFVQISEYLTINFKEKNILVDIDGDIRTLIDWENYETCNTSRACFALLFEECDCLRDASKLLLNIMELPPSCYFMMFYKCRNLYKAPDLPARKLSGECYNGMFDSCQSLLLKARIPRDEEVIKLLLNYDDSDENPYCEYMYFESNIIDLELTFIEETIPLNEEFISRQRNSHVSRIKVDTTPYIHFSCNGRQILSFFNYDNQRYTPANVTLELEYSIDKSKWTSLEEIDGINIYFENDIWLRGKNPCGMNGFSILFKEYDVFVNVEGDIKSLIDWENWRYCDTKNAVFKKMFKGCHALRDASKLDLSITELEEECYLAMFMNCDNLLHVQKQLPARELSAYCYSEMFYSCHSLVEAPELPAKEVPMYGYSMMFFDCQALETAPELCATTIEHASYYMMFAKCTRLKKAPDLHMKYVSRQYSCENMFKDCLRLEKKAKIHRNIFKSPFFKTNLSTQDLIEFTEEEYEILLHMYDGCPCEDSELPYFESSEELNEEYIPRLRRNSISNIDPYSCHPETKEELREIIIERIKNEGPNCNLNDIDVSMVTDMSYLFNADIHRYDKNGVNGNEIFEDFNGDISMWNVSHVTNMKYMFNHCTSFNNNISLWDVSSVTNMKCMFNFCKSLNSDISRWNVSNVTDMAHMFSACENFNSNISRWNVSSVTDMEYMFFGCKNFNRNISKWNVSNVTDMNHMFVSCVLFNSDISLWDVSNVTNMKYMFDECDSFDYDLSNWDISKAEYSGNGVRTVREHMWKYINEEYIPRLRRGSISKLDKYTCHPETKEELRKIVIECIKIKGDDCDLNDIDVSLITDMSLLFDTGENEIFRDFNGDISLWNVSNVTNMKFMFYGCRKFNSDLSKWDVSNVTNMDHMFWACENFNCDLSRWNVSSVTDMFSMFWHCKNFNYDLSNWNISKADYTESVREHMKHINEEYIPRQKRNSISRIKADNTPYIHLLTSSQQILTLYNEKCEVRDGLEYSLDKIEWLLLTDILENPIEFNRDLWLRGKCPEGTTVIDSKELTVHNLIFKFIEDSDVTVSGDIRTLIDWEDYENCQTENAKFMYLFYGCELIIDASLLKLNIFDLSINCYENMFAYCYRLEKAPDLPATNLASHCYHGMFYNCERLYTRARIPREVTITNNYGQNMYSESPCQETEDVYIDEDTTLNEEYISRQIYQPISRIDTPENCPYVHFHCDKEQYICIYDEYTYADKEDFLFDNFYHASDLMYDMEFSLDKEEWTPMLDDPDPDSFQGFEIEFTGDLWIRGKSKYGTATSTTENLFIDFRKNYPTTVSGDIRTLIDWENYETCDTSQARFCRLFDNCKALTDASRLKLELPTIADKCFEDMFSGCKNLKFPPYIPKR